jgi:NAD(P)-dependent dehydrogenase (short-subunit alcohol dehydrogenase family)
VIPQCNAAFDSDGQTEVLTVDNDLAALVRVSREATDNVEDRADIRRASRDPFLHVPHDESARLAQNLVDGDGDVAAGHPDHQINSFAPTCAVARSPTTPRLDALSPRIKRTKKLNTTASTDLGRAEHHADHASAACRHDMSAQEYDLRTPSRSIASPEVLPGTSHRGDPTFSPTVERIPKGESTRAAPSSDRIDVTKIAEQKGWLAPHESARMRLDGSTVVIIGGSSGVGEAIARLAIAEGARVVIAGRDQERLANAKSRLGASAVGFSVDITDRTAVEGLFAEVGSLDHLMITAGDVNKGTLKDMDPDQLRSTMEVRFWGPLYAVKFALPRMSSTGSITLTSGTAAIPHVPGSLIGVVAATVENLAGQLAAQLGPIRVNAVRLGTVSTPRTVRSQGSKEKAEEHLRQRALALPLRRVGQPDDVAQAAIFLMTNPYTTGIVVPVDGGLGLL